MSKSFTLATLLAGLAMSAAIVGCSKSEGPTLKPAAPVTETAPPADTTTAPAADTSAAPAGVPASFASLSDADRTAALAQKICPVSGEPLGEMGTPVKVTVAGRDVFLCCANCKEEIEKDPQKYLTKLDALK